MLLYRFFCFHGKVSNQNGPYIGASFGNHQHPNHWNRICPQHHRYVESKAQHNGEPHPAERLIPLFLSTVIEQHNYQKSQQTKGDIAADPPEGRCFGAEPVILRHHAQSDPKTSQTVHSSRQTLFPFDLIPLPPHIVEQHIKNGHGDRSNPFAQAQKNSIVLQPGSTQRHSSRDQVKRITRAQHAIACIASSPFNFLSANSSIISGLPGLCPDFRRIANRGPVFSCRLLPARNIFSFQHTFSFQRLLSEMPLNRFLFCSGFPLKCGNPKPPMMSLTHRFGQ